MFYRGIVACLRRIGNFFAEERFSAATKTPSLHTAKPGALLRGGFRLRLADRTRRGEPKYYFIFCVIKGGGSLTFNSLTRNPDIIHRGENFWKFFYCAKG